MERDPFEVLRDLSRLGEEFLKELRDADLPAPARAICRWGSAGWPPVDLAETPAELIVHVEIPGLRQASDVRVEIRGNSLILEGEVGNEVQSLAGARVLQRETRRGKFKRSVTLPVPVRGAQAVYRNGTLEIRLAKIQGGQAEAVRVEFSR